MSEEKSQLILVSRMLLEVKGKVSDVRLTFPSSKYGPMVLSLDARMQNVELEKKQEMLKVSWKTLDWREIGMNSNGATLEKVMTFCPEEEASKFKYFIGDKFIINEEEMSWALSFLNKENTIWTIDSYCLDIDGSLGYRLVPDDENIQRYQCTEEDLDREFIIVKHPRFTAILND